MGPVREMDGAELRRAYDDPYVRHHLDPDSVVRAFVEGAAAVVEYRSPLPIADGHLLTALGPATDLSRLVPQVVDMVEVPSRISFPAAAVAALPGKWRPDPQKQWHWMLTDAMPPGPRIAVEQLVDDDEVDALLDAHAPDAHARPGSPRVECWLGVREGGALVAVGALVRQYDGTGHLRAVTVVPEARGRGLGRELSAALTQRALDGGSGVASLGVYTDNEAALAVYRRLGYGEVWTFASGPLSGNSITTAVVPSR